MSLIYYNEYFPKLIFTEIGHHIFELVLSRGAKNDEIELHGFGLVDLVHVVQSKVLLVVLRHEGVVEAQHPVGVGLGDDFGNEGGLVVVEVHVADEEEVAFELMVLLALEEGGSDEKEF